ncbi:MAG TPA: histidine kinase [Actinomycetales bacterium]|nr:histidine kinase [Actinomycetales bacterium]
MIGRALSGALSAVAVTVAFVLVLASGVVDLRSTFEALVVPSAFVLAAAVGRWLQAGAAVTRLVAATGGLHLVAMVSSAWALAMSDATADGDPTTPVAGAVNVLSQIAYGLGFAALVAIAAVYPRATPPTGGRVLAAASAVAVIAPLAGGLAGPSASVLQPGEGTRLLGPIAHLLPTGLASLGGVVLVLPLAAALIFAFRYRRSSAEIRRGMRWPLLGVLMIGLLALAAFLLDSALPPASDAVFLLAAPLLPLSIVLGSSPRPPWDVDVLLRRGAVFGGTWAVAAASYGIGTSAAAWAAGGRGLAVAALLGGVASLTLATPVRRRLVALADERARLQEDLAAQVELLTERTAELDRSRHRIAAAREMERLRIERDLHDGVQQELLAVIAQSEAARVALNLGQVDVAARAVDTSSALARGTYETIRLLAQGIRPPVLEDLGLADAIAAKAEQVPMQVQVVADPALAGARWSPEIEGAAYFFVTECLANVVKHSGASLAMTEISYEDGMLRVDVRDNGNGGLNPSGGTGLSGLKDRLEAFGGTLSIWESSGWTTVRANLPAPVLAQ